MWRVLVLASALAHAAALKSRQLSHELPGIPIEGSRRPMPANGFGTCCRWSAKGAPLRASARTFLSIGGRLIDTAQAYHNHGDLKVVINESGVPREELWVTSKVDNWSKTPTRAEVVRAVDQSLEELGLSYIDLMLLHRPSATPEQRAEQWRGLQDAKAAGKVLNIGVSNYNTQQIQGLIAATGATPVVNQISYFPGKSDGKQSTVEWHRKHGIAVTAYSSLRGKTQRDVVKRIAEAHGASESQVLLRWALDQGVAVIPGATSEEHIRDNLATGDFRLTPQDNKALRAMP